MTDQDNLRLLIATDTHLGYMEKDEVRREDSFLAFQEVLQMAEDEMVDLILLGGDLFHDIQPSRKTLCRCMEIMRQHCFGEKPVQFQIVSEPRDSFHIFNGLVNYEDPNFNIKLPIFSIHGNHDEPIGENSLAALDVLSISGMVNYFGKVEKLDEVMVKPIMIKKGDLKVAIYGIGYTSDERLNRLWTEQKVKFAQSDEDSDGWFNVLALHQNRIQHGKKNWIPETLLPSLFDFVLWGHEHECLIRPDPTASEIHISQPGSSVATSLVEGEAKRKHVGILDIRKRDGENIFRLTPKPLKYVRPFIYEEITLGSQENLVKSEEAVREFLTEKVHDMIERAKAEFPEQQNDEKLKLPLIRLKVEYTGYPSLNPQRFGQSFVKLVANPQDILTFHRKNKKVMGERKTVVAPLKAPEPLDNTRIDTLVKDFFVASKKEMKIFCEFDLTEAVNEYVDKEQTDAIKKFVEHALKDTQNFCHEKFGERRDDFNESNLKQVVSERTQQKQKTMEETAAISIKSTVIPESLLNRGDGHVNDDEDENMSDANSNDDNDDDDDDNDDDDSDDDGGGKKKSKKKAPATKKAAAAATTTTTTTKAPAATSRRSKTGTTTAATTNTTTTTTTRGKKAPAASKSSSKQTTLSFDKAPTPAVKRRAGAKIVREESDDDNDDNDDESTSGKKRPRSVSSRVSRTTKSRTETGAATDAVVIKDSEEDSDAGNTHHSTKLSQVSAVSAWGRSSARK